MRIALIAPPFIPVPPVEYGGTELFIADLATGLQELGIEVVVLHQRRVDGPGKQALDVREIAVANQRGRLRPAQRLGTHQLGNQ